MKSNIQYIPWRFICIPLFVQQLVQENNKENINALHYLPFVRGTTNNRWALPKCRQCRKKAFAHHDAKAIDIAMYKTLSLWLQQNAVSETVVHNFGCSGCTRSFYHGNALWSPVTNVRMWNGLASVHCQAINLNNDELSSKKVLVKRVL